MSPGNHSAAPGRWVARTFDAVYNVAMTDGALKVRVVAHGEHLVIVPHEPERGIGADWMPVGRGLRQLRQNLHVGSMLRDSKAMLGVSEEALVLMKSIGGLVGGLRASPGMGDLTWLRGDDGRYAFGWRGPVYALIRVSQCDIDAEFRVDRDACTIIPNDVPDEALAAIKAGRRRMWKDPAEVVYTEQDVQNILAWDSVVHAATADEREDPVDPQLCARVFSPEAASAADAPIFPKTPFPIESSLILLGRRGSEAHGTYIPPEEKDGIDDRDLMGLCIPPEEMVIGTGGWEGAQRWECSEEINGVWDVVLYDVRKFVRLLCKQNPNALSLLWLEPEDYLQMSEEGRRLVAARDLFRARDAAYEAFVGYTKSQMEKMTSGAFKGYMGAKRKALVEKYGFDPKNAAHAVRLLHMGCEYQKSGRLTVRRVWDRQMLIEIKRGEWTLSMIKEHVADRLASMLSAKEESVLPLAIDWQKVEDLAVSLMRSHLGRGRRAHQERQATLLREIADELSSFPGGGVRVRV